MLCALESLVSQGPQQFSAALERSAISGIFLRNAVDSIDQRSAVFAQSVKLNQNLLNGLGVCPREP